jgi:hypothetical protein
MGIGRGGVTMQGRPKNNNNNEYATEHFTQHQAPRSGPWYYGKAWQSSRCFKNATSAVEKHIVMHTTLCGKKV